MKQLTLSDPPLQPFTNNTAACLSTAVAAALASLAEQQPVDGIISSQHCSKGVEPGKLERQSTTVHTTAAQLLALLAL